MATSNYPLTGFHFTVEWKGEKEESVSFSEVSGLSVSTTAIEYREGASIDYTTYKLPGLKKYNNVTLKRGTMATDNGFFDWFNTINSDKFERRTITISLLDETHKPVVTWKLFNAFPVKYDPGALSASKGEVLIESVELAYESFTVTRKS
ncbi:MAG: phage tail protein [Paludibacteraceae bacterium]|nr:phage tail protein [Paludibacteraceae bacterium]MBR6104887.1 phage tail protein [Paludibacteraceae bacterium]